MIVKNPLNALNPVELLSLQKGVRLGKSYLEKNLSQEEVETIFHLTNVPAPTRKKLTATTQELTGLTTLLLNTTITGIFGASLGLSGFLQFKISSWLFISLLVGSLLLGGWIGLHAVLQRRKAYKGVIEKYQLQDLEMAILKKLYQYKQQELNQLAKESHKPSKDAHEEHEQDPMVQTLKKSIYKLSQASNLPEIRLRSWIKMHFNRLMIELVPTLLGSVSSLFVYLGGTPQIAEQLGKEVILCFFSLPIVKTAELCISILLTLYFAYTFFHLNRKEFQRDREIAKMQALIARQETQNTLLDYKLYASKKTG